MAGIAVKIRRRMAAKVAAGAPARPTRHAVSPASALTSTRTWDEEDSIPNVVDSVAPYEAALDPEEAAVDEEAKALDAEEATVDEEAKAVVAPYEAALDAEEAAESEKAKAEEPRHVLADSLFDQAAKRADADSITLEQLTDYFVERGDTPIEKLATLFQVLDANSDGVIDRQEWREGFQRGMLSELLSTTGG